jgi:hypothetical protein
MHIYNWYHSDITDIHYVHGYVTAHCKVIPLLFALPFLHLLLLPICPSLLTWNPPCCDRICPPRSQVARKLIVPFPSPCSYAPHSKIPAPLGFSRSKYTFIRTTSRSWLTRSSTCTALCPLHSPLSPLRPSVPSTALCPLYGPLPL